MACFSSRLAAIRWSRKGSLSLNHADTLRVNSPEARAWEENSGNLMRSRFSKGEYTVRGKVAKT